MPNTPNNNSRGGEGKGGRTIVCINPLPSILHEGCVLALCLHKRNIHPRFCLLGNYNTTAPHTPACNRSNNSPSSSACFSVKEMFSCNSVVLLKLGLTLTDQVNAWFSSWVFGNIVGNPQRTIYHVLSEANNMLENSSGSGLWEVPCLGALPWHSEAWFHSPLIFNVLLKTPYLFVTKEPPPPPPHCYYYPKLLPKQSFTIFLSFWKKQH